MEKLIDFMLVAIMIMLAIIGWGYAKGENEIGTSLTKMQIEKYKKELENE